jgi:hypothetical protein
VCCFFTILVLLGPRAGILVWWLVDQNLWSRVYDTFIIPFLGFLFLPWTTLMYVIVAPGGIDGFDWVWIGLAVVADLASYSGGAYGNRGRMPGYARA